ncbi:Histone deacetylase 2, partial [Perkinsus olseni]
LRRTAKEGLWSATLLSSGEGQHTGRTILLVVEEVSLVSLKVFCLMATLIDGSKRPKDGVSLLFDESLEMYSLGSSHPMKTCRPAMVVDILRSTNCPVNIVEDARDEEMVDEDDISGRLDHGVMSLFHSSDYLETVRQVGIYRATG